MQDNNLISLKLNYFSFSATQTSDNTIPPVKHHACVDTSLRHRLENLKKKGLELGKKKKRLLEENVSSSGSGRMILLSTQQ